MNFQLTTLSNGLRVATNASPDAQGVTIYINVNVGSRNETEEQNGISHFIEHMIFKGTPTRTARQISEEIEGQGGVCNAYTGTETTCYHVRVPYEKMESALDVLTDIFYNSTFSDEEMERERLVISEEINMYEDMPDSVAYEQLCAQLWSGHPLGRPIAGPIDNVMRFKSKDLIAYRKQHYAPNRTLFFFNGRVDHETCVKAVTKIAGRLRNPSKMRMAEPFSPAIPMDPFGLTRKQIQQTQLAFAWRAPSAIDKQSATFEVLSNILGGNMSSRLFQEIREKRGLCYSIQCVNLGRSDHGALALFAGCAPSKAYSCAKGMLKEVQKLADKPVKKLELERTKTYLCGRFRLSLDTNPASWLIQQIVLNDTTDPQNAVEQVQSVTAADVQAAAQMLTRDKLSMSIVAPEAMQHTAEDWAKLRQ